LFTGRPGAPEEEPELDDPDEELEEPEEPDDEPELDEPDDELESDEPEDEPEFEEPDEEPELVLVLVGVFVLVPALVLPHPATIAARAAPATRVQSLFSHREHIVCPSGSRTDPMDSFRFCCASNQELRSIVFLLCGDAIATGCRCREVESCTLGQGYRAPTQGRLGVGAARAR
jgi:hypothetical protein